MYSKVEVQADEKCLTVWVRGQVVWRMWFTADGQLHGTLPHPEMVDQSQSQPPMSGNRRIEVHLLTKEKDPYDSMALPRLVSQRLEDDTVVRPQVERRNPSSGSSSGPLIDTHAVENVLNAIIDSILTTRGTEDKVLQAAESRRIAAEQHVGVGSVAAVRANFTRGRYGDPDELVATRISWLTREQPEKLRGMIEVSRGATA